jgi:hypothetical protein
MSDEIRKDLENFLGDWNCIQPFHTPNDIDSIIDGILDIVKGSDTDVETK